MTGAVGPVTLAYIALLGGALGVLAVSVLVMLVGIWDFRRMLRDDISRWQRARAHVTLLPRWIYHDTDWRAVVLFALKVSVAGAVVLVAVAIFAIGLIEVFAR